MRTQAMGVLASALLASCAADSAHNYGDATTISVWRSGGREFEMLDGIMSPFGNPDARPSEPLLLYFHFVARHDICAAIQAGEWLMDPPELNVYVRGGQAGAEYLPPGVGEYPSYPDGAAWAR
jgi:hypothetical protein